jgi:hypothetical protein
MEPIPARHGGEQCKNGTAIAAVTGRASRWWGVAAWRQASKRRLEARDIVSTTFHTRQYFNRGNWLAACRRRDSREKGMGVMSAPDERIEDMAGSLLRIYREEENESGGPGEADDFEGSHSSKRSEAEVEAFWAGRIPANRHSARVAA